MFFGTVNEIEEYIKYSNRFNNVCDGFIKTQAEILFQMLKYKYIDDSYIVAVYM